MHYRILIISLNLKKFQSKAVDRRIHAAEEVLNSGEDQVESDDQRDLDIVIAVQLLQGDHFAIGAVVVDAAERIIVVSSVLGGFLDPFDISLVIIKYKIYVFKFLSEKCNHFLQLMIIHYLLQGTSGPQRRTRIWGSAP